MPPFLKHALLATVSVPLSFLSYHLAFGKGVGTVGGGSGFIADVIDGLTLRPEARLSELSILTRDFYFVQQKYVERDRLDPEAMFDAALDRVERTIPEVLVVRQPGGDRLQISVGTHTTALDIPPIKDFDELEGRLRQVASFLDQLLPPEVDRRQVEYSLINGALSTLDPHTLLMDPEQAHEFDTENKGDFGGLGISIVASRKGWLKIKEVIDGTPAARAGLMANDEIIRIGDESTINMDLRVAVRKLRGEVGTPVTITVRRKSLSAKPFLVTIIRDHIPYNQATGTLLEGGVGYIRIPSFNAQTYKELDAILTRLGRENGSRELRGLILDLRSNPGGYLNQAVQVVDRFVDDGMIVATVEGAHHRREEQRASSNGTEPPYPMAVLVNGNSASASEIVSGALRNLGRAVIIGERTFGKGSVQHLLENPDHSQLKLTVAKYLTPGDKNIQSVGIPPDIALEQSVVRPADPKGQGGNRYPVVSLYWRDWLEREVDLDHHLTNDAKSLEKPAYTVRYLKKWADGPIDREFSKDPTRDWQVRFAREVLLAASSSRRADVIRSAAPVVARHQQAEHDELRAAFRAVGIDWTDGVNPATPHLKVSLYLGDAAESADTTHGEAGVTGVLQAGRDEEITLEVTNTGEAPLYQLSAYTQSANPWLDHREFYFGYIEPGQTRSWVQYVSVPDGYHEEVAPLDLVFRDPKTPRLTTMRLPVRTVGRPMPRFAYTVKLVDDGSGDSRGDGDGLPDIGEVVDLVVEVTNIGKGPTHSAYVRIKKPTDAGGLPIGDADDGLDLRKGLLELGQPRTPDGTPCKLDDDDPGDDACHRVLEPGETQQARLSFEVRKLPDSGHWTIDLQVGDDQAYDYATVQRGGFYDYFQLQEELRISPNTPLDPSERRPPVIAVSRGPDLRTQQADAVLSGVVSDDRSVRDVLVFHGDDKVFYRSGHDGDQRVPFTLQDHLKPGFNEFYILARDEQGLVATRSVPTWYQGSDRSAVGEVSTEKRTPSHPGTSGG